MFINALNVLRRVSKRSKSGSRNNLMRCPLVYSNALLPWYSTSSRCVTLGNTSCLRGITRRFSTALCHNQLGSFIMMLVHYNFRRSNIYLVIHQVKLTIMRLLYSSFQLFFSFFLLVSCFVPYSIYHNGFYIIHCNKLSI